jgi:hypothetical protein
MIGLWNEQKANELIPAHMRERLRLYICHRIEPGSFLSAVLSNNLTESFGRADYVNRDQLFNYVTFLYNYAPSECWGSKEKYQAWLCDQQDDIVDQEGLESQIYGDGGFDLGG